MKDPFLDFLEEGPSFDDPDIQKLISDKYEFNSLAPPSEEPNPLAGKLYTYQMLTSRILEMKEGGFLIKHKAGTGKTRTVISYMERCIENSFTTSLIVIVVSGPGQKKNIYDQIIAYAPEKYKSPTGRSENEKYKKSKILVNMSYKIATVDSFAKEILDARERSTLIRKYSGMKLWIDEECIGVSVDSDGNAIHKGERYDPDAFSSSRGNKKEKKKKGSLTNADKYDAIYGLVKETKAKVIITTETPLRKNHEHLSSLLNLIDLTQVVPGKYNYKNATEEELEELFRGKFSTISKINVGVKTVEVGEDYGDKDRSLILHVNEMNHFQGNIFRKIYNRGEGHKKFALEQIQTSTAVFPDGSTRAGVYLKNTRETTERKVPTKEKGLYKEGTGDVPVLSKKFLEQLEKTMNEKIKDEDGNETTLRNKYWDYGEEKEIKIKIEAIRKFSSTYAEILDNIFFLKFRDDDGVFRKGNVFVQSMYIENTGLILLGAFLLWLGYEYYDGRKDPFDDKLERVSGLRVPRIQKKRRFCMLTSATVDRLEHMINLQQSPFNYDGDYLRIFITSRVGILGFSLHGIRQKHILPSWVKSEEIQSLARGERVTAYKDLIRVIMTNGVNNPVIVVKVFRHAAIYKNESEDIHVYETALRDDNIIRRTTDQMEINSVDFLLNCARIQDRLLNNTLKGHSNYVSCPYSPGKMDFSTYYSNYIEEDAHTHVEKIKIWLLTHDSYDLRNLIYPELLLAYIINIIDSNRTWSKDRYGFPCYLVRKNLTVYTCRNFDIPGTLKIKIGPDEPKKRNSNMTDLMKKFITLTEEETIEKEYEKLESSNIILFLELIYPEKQIETTNQVYKFLIRKFRNVIFKTPEPDNITSTLPKSEKKRKTDLMKKIGGYSNKFVEKWEKTRFRKDMIYIHVADSLNNIREGRITDYINATCKLRLCSSTDNIWRDPRQEEIEPYTYFVQWQIEQIISENYNNNPFLIITSHFDWLYPKRGRFVDKRTIRPIQIDKLTDKFVMLTTLFYLKYGKEPTGGILKHNTPGYAIITSLKGGKKGSNEKTIVREDLYNFYKEIEEDYGNIASYFSYLAKMYSTENDKYLELP